MEPPDGIWELQYTHAFGGGNLEQIIQPSAITTQLIILNGWLEFALCTFDTRMIFQLVLSILID